MVGNALSLGLGTATASRQQLSLRRLRSYIKYLAYLIVACFGYRWPLSLGVTFEGSTEGGSSNTVVLEKFIHWNRQSHDTVKYRPDGVTSAE